MLDDGKRGAPKLAREAEGPEKAEEREGDNHHDDAGRGEERAHCGRSSLNRRGLFRR